jgi:hypothetical protein
VIDLDAYAEPRRDAATLAARREALLDQLGWLEDEAAALGPLLATLPPWAVEEAPLPTDLSVKQTLAAMAAADRDVHPAWIGRAVAEDAPALATPAPDTTAATAPLDDLLGAVRAARAAFRARFAEVAPDDWARPLTLDGQPTDLYGLALTIARRDADALKELAYRLHAADLRS